jgi:hypothetical protein
MAGKEIQGPRSLVFGWRSMGGSLLLTTLGLHTIAHESRSRRYNQPQGVKNEAS